MFYKHDILNQQEGFPGIKHDTGEETTAIINNIIRLWTRFVVTPNYVGSCRQLLSKLNTFTLPRACKCHKTTKFRYGDNIPRRARVPKSLDKSDDKYKRSQAYDSEILWRGSFLLTIDLFLSFTFFGRKFPGDLPLC